MVATYSHDVHDALRIKLILPPVPLPKFDDRNPPSNQRDLGKEYLGQDRMRRGWGD